MKASVHPPSVGHNSVGLLRVRFDDRSDPSIVVSVSCIDLDAFLGQRTPTSRISNVHTFRQATLCIQQAIFQPQMDVMLHNLIPSVSVNYIRSRPAQSFFHIPVKRLFHIFHTFQPRLAQMLSDVV